MLKMTLNNLQLFAHKKGGGSTSNGRDSQAKRLGAKAADGQTVTGGSILYRQRGTHICLLYTSLFSSDILHMSLSVEDQVALKILNNLYQYEMKTKFRSESVNPMLLKYLEE